MVWPLPATCDAEDFPPSCAPEDPLGSASAESSPGPSLSSPSHSRSAQRPSSAASESYTLQVIGPVRVASGSGTDAGSDEDAARCAELWVLREGMLPFITHVSLESLSPNDFQPYTHPIAGNVYYYSKSHRICTSLNVHAANDWRNLRIRVTPDVLARIAMGCEVLCNKYAPHLVVCHASQTATGLFPDPQKDVPSAVSHLYFEYRARYPCHHDISESAGVKAIALLASSAADHILNPLNCNSPISRVEMEQLLRYVKDLHAEPVRSVHPHHYTYVVADVLQRFLYQKWKQEHGLSTLSKYRDPVAIGAQKRILWKRDHAIRHSLCLIGIAICLGTPLAYLRKIDRIMGTQSDWNQWLLIGTVLLSVTVQMLSVDGMGATTRTSCLMAAMFALAAMSMAAIFIWVHASPRNDHIYSRFLDRAGPYSFATLASLPAALLGYAILTFTVTVISYSISGATIVQPDEQRPRFDYKAQYATSVVAAALIFVATTGVGGLLWAKTSTRTEGYAPTIETVPRRNNALYAQTYDQV